MYIKNIPSSVCRVSRFLSSFTSSAKLLKGIQTTLGSINKVTVEGESLKLVSVNFCKNAIFVLRKR